MDDLGKKSRKGIERLSRNALRYDRMASVCRWHPSCSPATQCQAQRPFKAGLMTGRYPGETIMVSSTKSLIIQRSIAVAGRKTSVSMEQPFWDALKEIAQAHNQSLARIVTRIKEDREDSNLSSEVRLFVFDYFFHKKHAREDNRIQKILLAT
jgi:predicted DNA-binding ribbon-helix-helix protein